MGMTPKYTWNVGKTRKILGLGLLAMIFLAGCSAPETAPPGEITIQADGTSSTLTRSFKPTPYNLERINSVTEPSIHQPISVAALEDLEVSGWAVDQAAKTEPSAVEVVIDGKAFRAKAGLERKDVAAYLKVPGYSNSGFAYSAPASGFGKGKHSLVLRIIDKEGKTYFETSPVELDVK